MIMHACFSFWIHLPLLHFVMSYLALFSACKQCYMKVCVGGCRTCSTSTYFIVQRTSGVFWFWILTAGNTRKYIHLYVAGPHFLSLYAQILFFHWLHTALFSSQHTIPLLGKCVCVCLDCTHHPFFPSFLLTSAKHAKKFAIYGKKSATYSAK